MLLSRRERNGCGLYISEGHHTDKRILMEGDLQRPRTLPTIAFAQPLSPVCDPMRFPAKFQLRRILRRFASASPVSPQDNTIVRDPTRGACGARAWLPTIRLSSVAGRLRRRRRASLPVERQGRDPTVDLVEQSPRFGTADSAIVCLQLVSGDAFRETSE